MPEFNEIAGLFPLMTSEELEQLAADIKENGLLEPITTHQGAIVDGRNRFNACKIAKVEPTYEEWNGRGKSLLAFVVGRNLHRRHLTLGQRSMIAESISAKKQGGQKSQKSQPVEGNGHAKPANVPVQPEDRPSQAEAAEALQVSERSIRDARKVRRDATPETVKAVEDGKKSLHQAVKETAGPSTPEEPETPKDGLGNEIPKKLSAAFEARVKFDSLLSKMKGVIQAAKTLADEPGGELLRFNEFQIEHGNSRRIVTFARPYCICPYCRAKKPKCDACKGLGWMCKDAHERVPRELK